GRTETPPRAEPTAGRAAADLAPRRADRRPRRGGAVGAHRRTRCPHCRRRPDSRRQPRPVGHRRGGGAAAPRRGSPMIAFRELLRRDLVVAWREGGTIGAVLGFYLIVVTMLPLGLGPDLKLLARIAPGILWVALLLAALLSLGRLFEVDLEDGSL